MWIAMGRHHESEARDNSLHVPTTAPAAPLHFQGAGRREVVKAHS
jgi:hypothetical protein